MADETPPGDAQNPISALFGENPPPGAPSDGGAAGTPQEAPETYVPGRIPKAFHREDGQHDYDGMSKSWFDTRSALQSAQARIKELEAAGAGPGEWDAYAAAMDWDAVKEKAPKAYVGGGVENKAAMALLRRLHEHGVPGEKARALVGGYYSDLDALVPEVKDTDTLRKEAVGMLGPNGPAIASEVKRWLETQHAQEAFSEAQLAALGRMTLDGTSLSLLQRLSRQGTSAAPPSSVAGVDVEKVDPKARLAELERRMGAMSDAEFAREKDALEAEWRQLAAA